MQIEFNEKLEFLFKPARLKISYGGRGGGINGDKMKSGIYKLLNKVNGKFYVGSAVNFNRRFARHKRLLNSNAHPNGHLQLAWIKYWEQSFEFIILEYCEKDKLIEREQVWLDWTKCWNREIGYNICKIADNRTGILHSDLAKKKMSNVHKGRVKSSEWQAKITASITGKKRDPAVGKAHSNRMKGRKLSAETRAKMAKSQTGRKHSEDSKLKRSLALKGRLIRPMVNLNVL